jgi:outer membrane protein OmpA-like peptidoglycan-associated protein
MKKNIIPLSICLIFISGCSWRNKKTSDASRSSSISSQEGPSGIEEHSSLFDVNEEAFILEESSNPFASREGSIELVDAPLWEQDQRAEFEPIYFDFDQYKVKAAQKATIERNIIKIQQALTQENAYVVVEGHACKSAGTPRYNTMLSERRAKEIQKELIKQGIPANKIKIVGRGSEMCKVESGNREQQAPNRRVEFYIVHEQK